MEYRITATPPRESRSGIRLPCQLLRCRAPVEPPSPSPVSCPNQLHPAATPHFGGWVARIDPTYNMTYYFDLSTNLAMGTPTASAAR